MSAPETKALSPAPESTMTRIESSARKSSIASAAASDISSEKALRLSGLLKTRCPIAPFFFARILLSSRTAVAVLMLLLLKGTPLLHGDLPMRLAAQREAHAPGGAT